ncbi:MAG TPA: sigma-70 family RNA polymerase sigma factor [Polyangiaceae bacterium]|nr:sigma-70 family RNA polymerase sigma factor [Polyangiaceae bacterium]
MDNLAFDTAPTACAHYRSNGYSSAAALLTPTAALASVQAEPLSAAALEEAELVSGLLTGSASAWREFNIRYSRLILSCISRVTARFGRVSPEDVREIHATLCLQLLSNDKHKLRTFEPGRGARLGTWLGLLATHTAYDFLRAVRRTPRLDDLSCAEAEAVAGETPDPSESTLQRERARLLGLALEELSAKDREFVELYYVQGMSPEEVAQAMNVSVKTVYSKKHKLQSRLESLLSAERLAA